MTTRGGTFLGARRVALLVALHVAGAVGRAVATPPAAYPDPPQTLFADLFVAVQSERIFADSKAFPDAVPDAAPTDILARYHLLARARTDVRSRQELKSFVAENFVLPKAVVAVSSPPGQVSLITHIDGLWTQLTRDTPIVPSYSSLLPLPHAYVVPGGRFREIYYWDSYFTMLGLREDGRTDLVRGMVDDFAYLIDTYGHVPNGTRTYYLSRSQPPLFFAMVALLSPDDPAVAYARYLPELEREYAFWMQGASAVRSGNAQRRVVAMSDGARLNRYWDDRAEPRDEAFDDDRILARESGREPATVYRDIRAAAESGWDFSSRWFGDGRSRATIDTTEIVPIDLNSLLYGLENAIVAGCRRQGDTGCVKSFSGHAAARRAAIDRYLWDASRRAYVDYWWTRRVRRSQVTAATVYPLFVRLSGQQRAMQVADTLSRDFVKPGGVVTTLVDTGQQWDAPNGWAPIQWIAVEALRHYGREMTAEAVACRWMVSVSRVYRRSGKLVEKYDVMNIGREGGGGEYPTQDGFGWTNGVARKLSALYPADADFTSSSQCPHP